MYDISICGHFGGNENFLDGQTVKTKNIYNALLSKYDRNNINIIDTYQWKKHPIKFLNKCIDGIKKSRNMIILPAQNGVKIFVPLFLCINKFYKRKIFYVVIGGWLPELVENKPNLIRKLKKLDKIFVETNNMKKKLANLDIKNVEILVNFKNIAPLKEEELSFNYSRPYKLCTFSRVMQEKGIEDAINVIRKINEDANEIVYELDIYGPIDKNYENRFKEIMKEVPNYIQYKGCIDSNKSVETLKEYYLLLFPTRFKTEGIPGTIIDSLSAGVPIVASAWENINEIICDNETGYIYIMYDTEEFYNIMSKLSTNCYDKQMKINCIEASKKFHMNVAIKKLIKSLEE